jgi:hypothetical protein
MKGEKERGGEKEDMHLEEPNRGWSSSSRSRRHRRHCLTNPSKKKGVGGGGEVEEEIEGGVVRHRPRVLMQGRKKTDSY